MIYKPVVCEINLLTKSIIPSIKKVFTDKYVFLVWTMLSAPYYIFNYFEYNIIKYIYLMALGILLIYLLHKECIDR